MTVTVGIDVAAAPNGTAIAAHALRGVAPTVTAAPPPPADTISSAQWARLPTGPSCAVVPSKPADVCKDSGFKTLTDARTQAPFRNQGQCVSSFRHA